MTMQDMLFGAALALLADGAVIEQTASAPLTYRIIHQGASVPLSGGISQRLRIGQHIRSGHATSTASNGSYLPCSAFSNHSWAWMALGRAKPSATHGLGEPDILENQKPRLCASLFSVIDIQRCYK